MVHSSVIKIPLFLPLLYCIAKEFCARAPPPPTPHPTHPQPLPSDIEGYMHVPKYIWCETSGVRALILAMIACMKFTVNG